MLRFDINVIFTVINLLILYFLMKKFLFGRVHNILLKRQESIDKAYQESEQMKAEAAKSKAEMDEQLKSIDEMKAKALADSHAKSAAEYDRIIADANARADEIIKTAEERSKRDAEMRIEEARNQIADMVIDAAGKINAVYEDPDRDSRLYERFTEEMNKEAGKEAKA